MTHNELLAKLLISDETKIYETLRIFQLALYAVVELHKPVKYKTVLHVRTGCACGAAQYPCSTIQAIEKELK